MRPLCAWRDTEPAERRVQLPVGRTGNMRRIDGRGPPVGCNAKLDSARIVMIKLALRCVLRLFLHLLNGNRLVQEEVYAVFNAEGVHV